MDVPASWMRIDIDQKFAFWIPSTMREVVVRGIDSFVRRWEDKDMVVHFDYGRFSDPLTNYSDQRSYERLKTQVGERSAIFVSFQLQNGWWFTGVHFPNLWAISFGSVMKFTLVAEGSPAFGKEVPKKVLNSFTFSSSGL